MAVYMHGMDPTGLIDGLDYNGFAAFGLKQRLFGKICDAVERPCLFGMRGIFTFKSLAIVGEVDETAHGPPSMTTFTLRAFGRSGSVACCRFFGHAVKLAWRVPRTRQGSDSPQCRVPSPRIVKALDVIEHIRPGVIPRPVELAGRPLGLERREEALHRRIVPDIARPANRRGDGLIGHQPLELLACILAALVAVVQQAVGPSSAPDSHDEGVGHEPRRHLGFHGPTDDAPREQVDDGRDVRRRCDHCS